MKDCEKKYNMLKVRDVSDTYYTKVPDLFDLPMKLLVTSKSQYGCGKTTIVANLLANDKFPYHKLFDGDDIYIISNNGLDNKLDLLAKRLRIPDENRMEYDEDMLDALYDQLEDEFTEAVDEGEKPTNKLIVFDDCGYSGDLKNKNFGIVSKIISNGRHALISSIFNCQKYTQASSTLRTNASAMIIGGVSSKELDLIAEDVNMYPNKKDFVKLFRANTKNSRDFFVCNFTGDDGLYYNKHFQPISLNKIEEKSKY